MSMRLPPHLPFSFWYMLIALWSVALAFLMLSLAGMSHLLSNLAEENQVIPIVEIAFFVLSGIFAVILWRYLPAPRTMFGKFLAFLLTFFIFTISLL